MAILDHLRGEDPKKMAISAKDNSINVAIATWTWPIFFT